MIKLKNTYEIKGMTCDGCVQTIKNKLELENDIIEANISLNESKIILISKKDYKSKDLDKITKNVGSYSFHNKNETNKKKKNKLLNYIKTYKPILLALFFVILLAFISSIEESFTYKKFFRLYMGYFFIIFSFLKLQNINQFAISFSKYDPISKKYFKFGVIYPFLELFLGILFILNFFGLFINILTIIIFIPQTIGIIIKLRNNEKISCACVGTSIEIPISNLTILENLIMCLMAIYMIAVSI
jgi:copper chaperone CopZ|tara:strand:- start:4733 stop:5464 length:732 start_codon:yes stop_codon:yes gene_type:complete